MAEYRAESIKREQALGVAKLHKNRMKELLEEAERLAADAATGQIRLELSELLAAAEAVEDDDLEGRVFDQSNIKTVEELRRTPQSEDWTDEDE